MRTACEFFGYEPYSSFAPLADEVQRWAETVSAHVEQSIKTALGPRYDDAFDELSAYRPRRRQRPATTS
jgi:hypothetical protein